MSGKLSTLLGLAVGVALTAALLVPEADHARLVAMGVKDLLGTEDSGGDLGGDVGRFAAGEARDGAIDGAGDGPADSLFAVLDRLATGLTAPRVALTSRLDGTAVDEIEFRRAFGSSLNLFNRAAGRDGADPARPRVVLAEPGASADLAVALDVTSAGGRVRLTGTLSRGALTVAVAPDPSLPGDQVPSWELPGRLSLMPPLLAIVVALVFRRTLLALFVGILSGAVIIAWQADPTSLVGAFFTGLLHVFDHYLLNELVDTFRLELIGFVIGLVAMVGVMSRSGGVQGLVNLLLRFAKTVRSTLLATWGMGLLIFFDDYANCLLVGNTMRPLTDKMRISREKLAYIVDSTAAPIAGVSVLSTWIAFEVSTFQAHLPGAGITDNAYAIFLQTLPFRYYCWFTLAFVGLTILTGRDFGPMAKAEARARTTGQLVRKGGVPLVSDEATRIEAYEGLPFRWTHGALPIALVLVMTLWRIFVDGGGPALLAEHGIAGLLSLQGITEVLFNGSGAGPILVGAASGFWLAAFLAGSNALRWGLLGGLAAGLLATDSVTSALAGLGWLSERAWGQDGVTLVDYTVWSGTFVLGLCVVALGLRLGAVARSTARPHLPGREIRRASLASIRALFFAVVILFQAWMIGAVCADMSTADYLVALLSGTVTPVGLPVLLFVAACLVAFSTGSSWSTMSILLPNVVALAAAVGTDAGMGAQAMVVVCIGAVLEGSIFGDHCSPISDTTVLSSVSSASDHVDHVRTQAPYALTTAALAIVVGYMPTVAFDWWTPPLAIGTGVLTLLVLLLVVGRPTPAAPDDDAEAPLTGAGGEFPA